MKKYLIQILFSFSFILLIGEMANAQAQRYRVACAGNQGFTMDDFFSGIHQGLICQNPHSSVGPCNSGNVGSAQGTAQCMVQDQNDMTGTNGSGHGTFQTENCVCVDCETDGFQQAMLTSSGNPDMNDYACQGYSPAPACIPNGSDSLLSVVCPGGAAGADPNCCSGYSWNDCVGGSGPRICIPDPGVTPAPSNQVRVVECRDSNGFTIPDSFCTGPKPPDTQVCGAPVTPAPTPVPTPAACGSGYSWKADGGVTFTDCTGSSGISYIATHAGPNTSGVNAGDCCLAGENGQRRGDSNCVTSPGDPHRMFMCSADSAGDAATCSWDSVSGVGAGGVSGGGSCDVETIYDTRADGTDPNGSCSGLQHVGRTAQWEIRSDCNGVSDATEDFNCVCTDPPDLAGTCRWIIFETTYSEGGFGNSETIPFGPGQGDPPVAACTNALNGSTAIRTYEETGSLNYSPGGPPQDAPGRQEESWRCECY